MMLMLMMMMCPCSCAFLRFKSFYVGLKLSNHSLKILYLSDIVSGKFNACLHWKAVKARYFGNCSDSIIAPLLAGIKMLPTSEYFKVFVQIFKASDMSRSSWDMSFSHVPTEQFEDHVSWVWRNLCSHGSQPFLAAKLMANGRLAPGKFWESSVQTKKCSVLDDVHLSLNWTSYHHILI